MGGAGHNLWGTAALRPVTERRAPMGSTGPATEPHAHARASAHRVSLAAPGSARLDRLAAPALRGGRPAERLISFRRAG
jgi:hypothetical protein